MVYKIYKGKKLVATVTEKELAEFKGKEKYLMLLNKTIVVESMSDRRIIEED